MLMFLNSFYLKITFELFQIQFFRSRYKANTKSQNWKILEVATKLFFDRFLDKSEFSPTLSF